MKTKMNPKAKKHSRAVGSSLEDFLKEEGIMEEVQAVAVKRVIALQVRDAMRRKHLTKKAMAERMHTNRSTVDRLLDGDNDSVTLDTLGRAAAAVGRRLKVELVR